MNKKYDLIFEDLFRIKVTDEIKKELVYRQYPQWDSLAQMMLIQRIETDFNITISFDEMLEINSYENGLKYLKEKCNGF